MKRLRFTVRIYADKQKVWSVLWQESTYRRWTSAFDEGSHAVSDWKKGSRILFLNSKGDGMFSLIENNIPNAVMSFRHLGEVKDGIAQSTDESSNNWKGSLEIYMLTGSEKDTELDVEIDVPEGFESYMERAFTRGILTIKDLAER
jgi:hypothetical protein